MAVSYNNEKGTASEVDYATDPASGTFFNTEYKKNEDLKQMLDSNKDSLKLEAMKRIIGMVAKGKDASDLFPAVVKNVVSANLEVKKLVYVYLVRYAEEQQDLALLSISTFQRALKDPNPLIRACALRVLSSIRVPVIVPIMMLAIKETVTDLSPYVRKTTAHAIPKLYSLDPEQKDELVKVIEKLLSDMSTLVVGSTVMAFEEVCPERIDLIHSNYRKLCCLLVDVEEWGQVVIINMLTRYARTQFVDPNKGNEDGLDMEEEERPFYDDEEKVSDEPKKFMDQDHRLLLTTTKPLLQSRNAAVVLAVAQLYQHIAPKDKVACVARALIRLLRGHREIQVVVLTNIASLSTQRKGMFEPFLKSFFVRSSDPTQIKILKLEVMTNLATETNVSLILREFQTYIWSPDKEFVAAAIQAIGRCASTIKDVTDSCLNGLVMLLSNKDPLIVGESVVVVRKLLQTETVGHKHIISHMASLVDNIEMPTARASILWLLGEYCEKVPKIAPDVLRRMAKNFVNESDMVKLQIITLATKLYLTNPKQTHLLFQYVFNLAKFDTNYDIRDRARFMRAIVLPPAGHEANMFSKEARNIFMAAKPAPVQQSTFKDRDHFQLSTLSHLINACANGYQDLPDFPLEAPPTSVRETKEAEPKKDDTPTTSWGVKESKTTRKTSTSKEKRKEKSFYSDSEEEEDEEGDSSGESDSSNGRSSSSGSEETSSEESDSEEETSDERMSVDKTKGKKGFSASDLADTSSDTDSDSSDSDSQSESDLNNDEILEKDRKQTKQSLKSSKNAIPSSESVLKSNLDLLLDLDSAPTIPLETPILTPSLGGLLSPDTNASQTSLAPNASVRKVSPVFIPTEKTEILNRISGNGLSISMRFTRSPHLYSSKMTSIELTFTNHKSEEPITNLGVGVKKLTAGLSMHDFSVIPCLPVGQTLHGTMGVDFNDSIQPAHFDIVADGQNFAVSITPNIGELVCPVTMNLDDFTLNQGKLRGMNEHSGSGTLKDGSENSIEESILQQTNLAKIESNEATRRFCGETASGHLLVLLTIGDIGSEVDGKGKLKITVNCEKLIIASMMLKLVQNALGTN